MAKLNSSGKLSLAGSTSGESVALTLGRSATAQISLGESGVSTDLAGITAGQSVSMSNLYGKFKAVTVTAYGIGGGGGSRFNTTGGSGGGGAVVKAFTVSPNSGSDSLTVIVGSGGQGGTGYAGNGTASSLYGSVGGSFNGLSLTAGGGTGGYYGPPCGNCWGGPSAAGGGASGGDLNLSGGAGSGWNEYYCVIENVPQYQWDPEYMTWNFVGYSEQEVCYQTNGYNGASGVLNGETYYAAGGGGGGTDFNPYYTPGGSGGSYAGRGGYGYNGSTGEGGLAYGGGSGGAGNYGRTTGSGANGIWVLKYTSPTQLASGGTVTTSGSGSSTVWTHIFTTSGSFTVL